MAPQRKKAKTAAHAQAEAADPAIHPELAAASQMDPALLHPDLAAASQPTELSAENIAAIAAAAAAATPIPDTTVNTTTTPVPTTTVKTPRQRKNAAAASRAAVEAAAALHQQLESAAALAEVSKPTAEEPTVSVDAAAEFLRTIQERESQKNLLAHQAQQSQQHPGEPIVAADGSIPTDLASLYPHAATATAAVAAAVVAAHAQAPQQQLSYAGYPTSEQFAQMVNEYLSSLSPKKQTKALLTQAMYDDIREVLLHPTETKTGSAQFRFWSKKMFKLVSVQNTHIVIHENKPVAIKEQLYDVLVECHGQATHGGRDKTAAQVRKFYSWVPKELIARFVKGCPSCVRNTSPNS
jgi:hypothetical protein